MYYLITELDRNYYATIILAAFIIIAMLVMVFRTKGWMKFKVLLNPPAQYLETRNKLRAIELVPESILTTNARGIIVDVNDHTKELFERTEAELLGKTISTLLPDIENFAKFYQDHSNIKDGNFPNIEAINKSGQSFATEVIIGQWSDYNNPEIIFYSIIIRNISHRKANEEARAALQRQINVISGLSISGEYILQSGAWSWDMVNDIVDCSAGFCRIFNIQPSEKLTATEVISHIFFEDHAHLTEAMHNSMQKLISYDIEFRVVQRNGTKDKVRAIGVPVPNENGKMTRLNGAVIILTKNV